MKNKILIIGFVFILLSSFVLSQNGQEPVFENEFINTGKFTVEGTANNEYNNGQYYISDGFQGVFELDGDLPQDIYLNFGLISSDGYIINCFNETIILNSGVSPLYGYCDIKPESIPSTGKYILFLNSTGADENTYYLQTIDIIDAKFPILALILLILGGILIIASLFFREGILLLIGSIIITSASIDIVIVYYYALGVIGVMIPAVMTVLSLVIFAKVLEENLK